MYPRNFPGITLLAVFIIKILALVFGFLLIRMGKELIEDGLKDKFTFKVSCKGFLADLQSVSPGLLFVLLGVIMIIFIVVTNKYFGLEIGYKSIPDLEIIQNIPLDTLTF